VRKRVQRGDTQRGRKNKVFFTTETKKARKRGRNSRAKKRGKGRGKKNEKPVDTQRRRVTSGKMTEIASGEFRGG